MSCVGLEISHCAGRHNGTSLWTVIGVLTFNWGIEVRGLFEWAKRDCGGGNYCQVWLFVGWCINLQFSFCNYMYAKQINKSFVNIAFSTFNIK